MINFRQYPQLTKIVIPNNVMNTYLLNKSTINISNWFSELKNLQTVELNNYDRVLDMSYAYYNCISLKDSPQSGYNTQNMTYAYYGCSNLTGSPVCATRVTNLSYTYYGCSNLTGNSVCGLNVKNMSHAYEGCYSMTGYPRCNNNVLDMSYAYYNCTNINGTPTCYKNVTNMSYAYYNCVNLTGASQCNNNVIDMSYAYYNCVKLSGNARCNNNVTNMAYAYYNCVNLNAGNSTWYAQNITNVKNCFYGKNNSRRYNIRVPADSVTLNTCLTNNEDSLVGVAITWSKALLNNYWYNSAYNIYIYAI